ncbi:IMPACT family protein [Pseudarthrobacter raffinosi]|uniref:IMPACT family protein n=1 Tax=Pseudarthrobacter raffinosi TaxID=2953651 RepID=UPI00208F961D|nr:MULTISPECIES: YigZ family protein [unclassified Pseudarthrobacter]MCO4236459.1 YigZ family protein [Pseudarthrobacter sp. MDT3-28]MCO4249927.1 YigZ family protein [Pseudarthrobacter sp. MDT3-9]MCO4262382.1 YigZ family protein [Pseudarthrobacter sp. MDT3-26]
MAQTADTQSTDAADSRATAYTTLALGPEFRHEIEIKRSRFITVLRRADNEDTARDLVAALRREFHDARHHCSAFVLGPDRDIQRSNDDGEPSGTAGIPMLEAIIKRETAPGVTDLSDVSAVVVRYFGGILLGAGGLVRAYSESVSAALQRAPLVRRSRLRICSASVPHSAAGRLENDLRAAGFVMAETTYGAQDTVLRLAVPDDAAEVSAATDRVLSLTAGRTVLTPAGTEWLDVPLP